MWVRDVSEVCRNLATNKSLHLDGRYPLAERVVVFVKNHKLVGQCRSGLSFYRSTTVPIDSITVQNFLSFLLGRHHHSSGMWVLSEMVGFQTRQVEPLCKRRYAVCSKAKGIPTKSSLNVCSSRRAHPLICSCPKLAVALLRMVQYLAQHKNVRKPCRSGELSLVQIRTCKCTCLVSNTN